ncbi:hypothetical protein BT67DRAFT_339225, partial [Trichocladium antarcticum]
IRSRYSSRPVVGAALLIAVITSYALFLPAPGSSSGGGSGGGGRLQSRGVGGAELDCRLVHNAEDQCAFVLANCGDDDAGLIHYLGFYYCALGAAKPVAFAIITAWLGLLFTTIGIAASDFFSVNLSTIASVLGLSESLAGVTFLAFGNGSPDVFSTFAAMGSNSGSMAIGELVGAAGFITAVVAGSMALVREFKVSKRTFVRDIVFFIVAICFTMVFLADGQLHLWECFAMIGFYLFYVVVVVGWHWLTTRRRRQRMRDAASRTHLYGPGGNGADELEPYRDDPDEDEAVPVNIGRGDRGADAADISLLERGPRIEVDRFGAPSSSSQDEERDIQLAAEMASSMRVNRPRWGRSNTTITPIRPSLVGALEFRSVLSSLQKERNMYLNPLHTRSRSFNQHTNFSADDARGRPRTQTLPAHVHADGVRERALSYGNPPLNLEPATPSPSQPDFTSSLPDTRTSSVTRTFDGRLAPPTPDRHQQFLQIRIPSPSGVGGHASGRTSPSLSPSQPFPSLSESPAALTPYSLQSSQPQEPAVFPFPFPSALDLDAAHHARRHSGLGLADRPRPVRWWPYRLLPAPHVVLATAFPTLQGWGEKRWWDKVVSLVSVPSILLLVITLPVVETERGDDGDSEADVVEHTPEVGFRQQQEQQEQQARQEHTNMAAPSLAVSMPLDGGGDSLPAETEWQAYRRRTRSGSSVSRSPRRNRLASLLSANTPLLPGEQMPRPADAQAQFLTLPVPKPAGPESDSITAASEAPTGWNRWLVAVQLFTGPFFVVLVTWLNTRDDYEQPGKMLVQMILYSLLVSSCLLGALLLTTTEEKKPRYHFLLCYLGFVISVAWISTIAGEVVGVLKAFGVILDISEAILGLTIFAVGSSLGDLVADITVARLGYPVMALAACFGGPMLNILLGVGIGGAWMGIRSANKHHRKHPDVPLHYKPYHIQVGGTLMVSTITVLLTLIILLIVVPSNNWIMSRKIGWGLIGIWTVGTIVSLVVEMTGAFSDVS